MKRGTLTFFLLSGKTSNTISSSLPSKFCCMPFRVWAILLPCRSRPFLSTASCTHPQPYTHMCIHSKLNTPTAIHSHVHTHILPYTSMYLLLNELFESLHSLHVVRVAGCVLVVEEDHAVVLDPATNRCIYQSTQQHRQRVNVEAGIL